MFDYENEETLKYFKKMLNTIVTVGTRRNIEVLVLNSS